MVIGSVAGNAGSPCLFRQRLDFRCFGGNDRLFDEDMLALGDQLADEAQLRTVGDA